MFKKNHKSQISPFLYLFLFVLLTIFPNSLALAHKVTIFAWIEGDTVHTQSKFSGGKRAKNVPVSVFDTEGHRLLEGKTDKNGEFTFKVPVRTGIKVVLNASMGHKAEWIIPAEEITSVSVLKNNIPADILKTKAETRRGLAEARTSGDMLLPTPADFTKQEIRDLINESLDIKLRPLINMLVNLQNSGPGITEIIGGIGYILGMVGIALYFASRRGKV